MIKLHQEEYYESLKKSGIEGESTSFIEFMLEIILKTILEYKVGNRVGNDLSDNQERILLEIKDNPRISARILAEKIPLSQRKVEENIAKLKAKKLLLRVGGTRGYWEIIG